MDLAKLNDWLQLAAAIGVLFGLLLVAMEIRQANEIANAEATADIFEGWELQSRVEMESDIKSIFERSFRSPEDLTTDEILRLDSWLTSIIMLYSRKAVLYFRFDYTVDPGDEDWADLAYYFDSPFTRAWYKHSRPWIAAEPKLVEIIDNLIETTPARDKMRVLEIIESELAPENIPVEGEAAQ